MSTASAEAQAHPAPGETKPHRRKRQRSFSQLHRDFQRTALCPKPEGALSAAAGRWPFAGKLDSRERLALRQLAHGAYDVVVGSDERGRQVRFLVAEATPLVLDVLLAFESEGDDLEPDSDDDSSCVDDEGEPGSWSEPTTKIWDDDSDEGDLSFACVDDDNESEAIEIMNQDPRVSGCLGSESDDDAVDAEVHNWAEPTVQGPQFLVVPARALDNDCEADAVEPMNQTQRCRGDHTSESDAEHDGREPDDQDEEHDGREMITVNDGVLGPMLPHPVVDVPVIIHDMREWTRLPPPPVRP